MFILLTVSKKIEDKRLAGKRLSIPAEEVYLIYQEVEFGNDFTRVVMKNGSVHSVEESVEEVTYQLNKVLGQKQK